ncbi:uncharacterized protein LOC108673517 [Hyalella azteca]|uniref:Uncharacterized protein LOC108673517 n=1 Tax=Hyalella azteca TaxID=294128 RepID=A0A8B7NT11_HYAAZ|nr:uncharacterized protein LOC108673517 [Hyalella azteca]
MKPNGWQESSGENMDSKQLKRQRRSNKPAMERRRRERINGCLEQLKNHVLVAEGKDPARYTKVEKADILEMTVRFLTGSNRRNGNPRNTPGSSKEYESGYEACMNNIRQMLSSNETILPETRESILKCLQVNPANKNTGEPTTHDTCCSTSPANCITIHSRLPGGVHRAKLAIKCSSRAHQQTVYIPPSNTWSPPVDASPNMVGLCSPPSTPESFRAQSPASFNSSLVSTVLQPHDPNTGKVSKNFANRNYSVIPLENVRNNNPNPSKQYPMIIYSAGETIRSPSPLSDDLKIRLTDPCAVTNNILTSYQPTSFYPEPQSVPLNLSAPKPKIKKEEEVVARPQYFERNSAERDGTLVGPVLLSQQELHMMETGEHWRPWFN